MPVPTRKQILNILYHSLQGINLEVVEHSDPNLVNATGTVMDESRYMLHLNTGQQVIKVSKLPGRFRIFTPSSSFVIDGQLLEGNAKRRSKKKLRHW